MTIPNIADLFYRYYFWVSIGRSYQGLDEHYDPLQTIPSNAEYLADYRDLDSFYAGMPWSCSSWEVFVNGGFCRGECR